MCTHADAGLETKNLFVLALPKFQNIAGMVKKPIQKFELKQEIKKWQKYTSNEEETFPFLPFM